jgi:ABC-2 type transport system ATP-binding protein
MKEKGSPALATVSLRKAFPDGTVALDGVDLKLARGSVTALVGDNGSGKTTLLRLCAGLLKPDAGSVRVLGFDPAFAGAAGRARIGYVAQAPQLDPQLSGAETLELYAALYDLGHGAEQLRELGRAFGLDEHWKRPVSSYSGGLRQRLHLTVGALHEPDVWLLDEPTAALDPGGRELVWKLVRERSEQGTAVLVATHDLAKVEAHCKSAALLHRGRLLAKAAPATLVAEHAGWTLFVQAATPDQYQTLRAELAPLVLVSRDSPDEREVACELGPIAAAEARATHERVLAALERRGIAVSAFRLEAPDLARAYFKLTGHSLKRPQPEQRHSAGGTRGARTRSGQGDGLP